MMMSLFLSQFALFLAKYIFDIECHHNIIIISLSAIFAVIITVVLLYLCIHVCVC